MVSESWAPVLRCLLLLRTMPRGRGADGCSKKSDKTKSMGRRRARATRGGRQEDSPSRRNPRLEGGQQSVQGVGHPRLATPAALGQAATPTRLLQRATPSKRPYEDTPLVAEGPRRQPPTEVGGQLQDLDLDLFDFEAGPLSPIGASVPELHTEGVGNVAEVVNVAGTPSYSQPGSIAAALSQGPTQRQQRQGQGQQRQQKRVRTSGPPVKREGWVRASDVRVLFEEDPNRPGYPLRVETINKSGVCVMKIRCRICRHLFSYHNSSWTCASNHILSHNIQTVDDVVAAAALATDCEANSEPFPMHKLPTAPAVKTEPVGDAALMRRTFAAPSYGSDTAAYHRLQRTIGKWIAADCLPYRTVETPAFRAMLKSLDPKCPDFGRKAITSQVRL